MNSEEAGPPIAPSAKGSPADSPSTVRRLARTVAVGFVLALLGLLVWSVVHSGNGARFTKQISQGGKPRAPTFALAVLWSHDETWPKPLRPRIRDGRLSLDELRGYPAVINFWASWCVPCKEEAQAFAAAAERFRGRVAFVGMDTQDLKSAARRFLRRYEVNYVSVRDGTDKTYTAYGLTGVPETYYVDSRGRVVEHAIGAVSKAELVASVERLIKESQ
jgi:cytochrome c biogenesis protein CcmG/thiol:disulfide interchange protein DsbE